LDHERHANEARRDRLNDRLRDLLAQLYDAATARRMTAELLAIVPDAPTVPRASNGDCLLITYADSIVDDENAPLQALKSFLDLHLEGVLGRVHILPFYPSSSDDGFAVIDYRMVDHHLGSWADVLAMERRYDLMFDLVINHCSRENLWFADFVSGREPGRNYFITLLEESDTSNVVRPRTTPLISEVHTYAGIRHVWNTFSEDQVDLDFSNPDVLREFVDILFFYVSQGARMIRLDAIAFLWKRLGTSCMSLPETHTVVKILRLLIEYAGLDTQLVTETNVPHEENVSYFGAGDEAHIVYQFSLAPLLLYSYAFGDASYLTTWAARLAPTNGTFLNFIASHDGIGLRPLEGLVPEPSIRRLVNRMHDLGGFVTLRQVADHEQKPYEINIALFSAFDENIDAFLGAHTLLVSFQGIPALYIHSLLATPNDLDLVEETGRTRSINRSRWSFASVEALLEDEASAQARVLNHFKHIIARRDSIEAFGLDGRQSVYPSPPGVFLMARESERQKVVVVASVAPDAQSVSLAGIDLPRGKYEDLLTHELVDLGPTIELGAYQVLWLDITRP
jgi:sucrose phosphorylase